MSAVLYRNIALLAPAMERATRSFIADANASGYDLVVCETIRTPERQAWLYASGRTRPGPIVTNAATVWSSWHGFGLACDACSQAHGWNVPDDYWRACAVIAARHGLAAGFNWHMRDRDHFQFGRCKISPSILSRQAYQRGGLVAVWEACGAL